ncbi:MAG: DUF5798 family protein [Halodesulfurarchaeum sp.]
MGLGGTAKKLQKVIDTADELYAKIGDLREELEGIRSRIESTNDKVGTLEDELEEQRIILERVAEANDVDIEINSGETENDQ